VATISPYWLDANEVTPRSRWSPAAGVRSFAPRRATTDRRARGATCGTAPRSRAGGGIPTASGSRADLPRDDAELPELGVPNDGRRCAVQLRPLTEVAFLVRLVRRRVRKPSLSLSGVDARSVASPPAAATPPSRSPCSLGCTSCASPLQRRSSRRTTSFAANTRFASSGRRGAMQVCSARRSTRNVRPHHSSISGMNDSPSRVPSASSLARISSGGAHDDVVACAKAMPHRRLHFRIVAPVRELFAPCPGQTVDGRLGSAGWDA
jgi:hypothetical protein